ncbi:MAG: hypothetical protein EXR31_10495 [Betaproteobacteria bacterium]|nr:hypothetical protein [Betaproteobacteria bacterium]
MPDSLLDSLLARRFRLLARRFRALRAEMAASDAPFDVKLGADQAYRAMIEVVTAPSVVLDFPKTTEDAGSVGGARVGAGVSRPRRAL